MGTHPIFESDFDCLTEKSSVKIADSTVSYTCKMNNEDSVESKNSGENTLAADNESIERKNEDTSMESGSPNSSESTESENQEESERSVSEDNLEESKEDFLFEIEKNLRNGHYKDYYYSMPPYFNQDHTFKEAKRQENREKNRYIDIMPYDKTRVILNVNSGGTSGKDSADAQGDYINANHIQFVDWPDHGVPHDPAHFLTFLRRIRELKKESDDEIHTIVHCSAGVGRTGVTIALDAAWERLQNGLTVDPKQLLEEMRNQRGCLIQTVQQFLFVCNTILHLAEEIKSASKNNCNLSERSK